MDEARESIGSYGYVTLWFCEPPPPGGCFKVITQKWVTVGLKWPDLPAQRRIYEWEPGGLTQTDNGRWVLDDVRQA